MGELPKRKPNRLAGYDYSKNGAYFLTICTKDRVELFGSVTVGAVENAGAVANRTHAYVELSAIGKMVENEIHTMQTIRKNVTVDRHIVMPNHVHMIIVIAEDGGRLTTAPTTSLSEIIRLWKRAISKQIGFSPWQKSFHDHIIRNEKEYIRIAEYIDHNPEKWEKDCFHPVGAVVNRPHGQHGLLGRSPTARRQRMVLYDKIEENT